MKKQQKQFLVVAILLVICVVAYIALLAYNKSVENKEAEESADIIVAEIDPDGVTAFSFVSYEDGETLSFTLADDGSTWTYDGDPEFDVDEDEVTTLLSKLESVEAKEIVEDYGDLSDYGFDDPKNVITATTASGTTTLTIGGYNDMLSEYYLTCSDSDDLYLISSTLYSGFNKTLDDLEAEEEDEEDTESDAEEVEGTEEDAAEVESTEEGTEAGAEETYDGETVE
ncbi:MAG: DUF4340 domain-containing protein [Clostridiales bacterium]|nr:DUF4340 domain-containing protein [Clostridiales bacterium]